MKNQRSFSLLIGLSAAFLPGCRAKNPLTGVGSEPIPVQPMPAPPIPVQPEPMPKSPFQVSARAGAAQFAVGKPVELAIEIKNSSSKAAELKFSSGQNFDFSATRVGDADFVWSYGMNKRFIQSMRTTSLEAGKTLSFTTVWTGAAAGTYTIKARITANGGLEAAPFQIVVK